MYKLQLRLLDGKIQHARLKMIKLVMLDALNVLLAKICSNSLPPLNILHLLPLI